MSGSTAPHRRQAPWTLELSTAAIFIYHQEALATTVFSNKRTNASKPSTGNYPAIAGSASVPKQGKCLSCTYTAWTRSGHSVCNGSAEKSEATIARRQPLSPQLPKFGKAAIGQKRQSWKENTRVENQMQRLSAYTRRILKECVSWWKKTGSHHHQTAWEFRRHLRERGMVPKLPDSIF